MKRVSGNHCMKWKFQTVSPPPIKSDALHHLMFCSVSSSTGCPSSEWRRFEVNDSIWSPATWRIPSSEYGMPPTNPPYYLRFCPIERYTFDIAHFSTYFFCSSLEMCTRKPIWDESDYQGNGKSSFCEYMGKYIRIGANSTQYFPWTEIDAIKWNDLSRRWTRGSSFEVIWYP